MTLPPGKMNSSTHQLPALAFWCRMNHSLVAFNLAFAKILKIDPAKLSESKARWDSLLCPEDLTELQAILDAGLQVYQQTRISLRIISFDGTITRCTVSISAILSDSNEEEILWSMVPADSSIECPSLAHKRSAPPRG